MQIEEKERIKDIFNSFISKMNNWEKYCNLIEQDKTLSFEVRFEKQKSQLVDIFDEYCTKKENLENQLQYHLEKKDLINMTLIWKKYF